MRFVIFTHSLVSDWNHGNAHFLRGIASELINRGHEVRVFEPCDGWSLRNLLADAGTDAVVGFHCAYPTLESCLYDPQNLDVDSVLEGTDVVLVHEWNAHGLVKRIGQYRKRNPRLRAFFHDTHHRSVTAPEMMAAYDLSDYDGVLAYGRVIADLYRKRGWAAQSWTWHEAADTRIFHPRASRAKDGDLVWIGNWGDGERAKEIREFLIRPVQRLGLKASVYGVRYPREALAELEQAGIGYGGRLPNYRAPEIYSRYRVTVHIPRSPYACALPGIPTIRPFEALACGIPLISAPWQDSEGLFRPGSDFLFASDGEEMTSCLSTVLSDSALSRKLTESGLETIQSRHTCVHRVDELMSIVCSAGNAAAVNGAA